jgi:hypothetical protein
VKTVLVTTKVILPHFLFKKTEQTKIKINIQQKEKTPAATLDNGNMSSNSRRGNASFVRICGKSIATNAKKRK